MVRYACFFSVLSIAWAPEVRAADATPITAAQEEFFEKHVRPVLAENCFSCHGQKAQQAGLRLDSRDSALKGGEGGPVVVPGKPEESELISAIRYETYEMPPKGKLDDRSIAALTEWVRMGAPWPAKHSKSPETDAVDLVGTHWSFQPIGNPPVPEVENPQWVRNPIDRFTLAELEKSGLSPSPPADRRTLIRRATMDLVGLPPTAEEVDAFVNDSSPKAFEKVVERLLQSPRYGERWGRHWLDVARYADTKGYVFTDERRYPYSYTYRDYVVQAFNDDLPIDRFIVEQLAADLIPEEEARGPESLAAMGFLTVGRRFLNNAHDIIDDRIDVATRGLMGLTVACARCHDHKFDPVPTADYYSLYGVFASSEEPDDLPLLPGNTADADQVRQYETEAAKRQQSIDAYLTEKQTEYRDKFRENVAEFLAAAHEMEFNPRHGKSEELAKKLGVEQRLLGAFVQQWKQQIDSRNKPDDPVFGAWHAFSQLPAEQFASRAPEIMSRFQENAAAHALVSEKVLTTPPESFQEVVGRYGQVFLAAVQADGDDPARQLVDAVAVLPVDRLNRVFNRKERDELRKRERELASLSVTHPGAPPRAMIMNDKPQPYNPYVFVRGTPGRRGDSVPRRFLEALSDGQRKEYQGSGRLELAKDIVSQVNPLTARVFVNRVWMHHFGHGIVRTPSDFGVQGEPPTHPQLLDHLAWTFREDGWSLKRLHRRIMLSATYRQASDHREECLSVDPENRLVWKQNKRRLEFEPMRDSMLAAADNLNFRMGGRPVDVTSDAYVNRRTLYGFIDRQNLDSLYRMFDFASPNASNPKRFVTTVPQQALFLMNGKFLNDQAKRLADMTASLPAEERIDRLYRRLFQRPADPIEKEMGLRFVKSQEQIEPIITEWQYGYGRVDEEAGSLTSFSPLKTFTENRWQYGAEYPHPQVGHLVLRADSGHPGRTAEHSTVLRWTAPVDGSVNLSGMLRHKQEQGDGVKGYVLSSRTGLLGSWVAHNNQALTLVRDVDVQAGETIEFVVSPQETNSHDSYQWAPKVRLRTSEPVAKETWDARADFQGPQPPPPTPWQLYAQTLLMSNEFCFVD